MRKNWERHLKRDVDAWGGFVSVLLPWKEEYCEMLSEMEKMENGNLKKRMKYGKME